MRLFRLGGEKLTSMKETGFDLERRLQNVIEENLETIFGLKFIRSEFPVHGSRIDTLAFDEDTKSFVIIEYKRDKSFSVVDQGVSYLSLMLNNKAEFILEFMERNPNSTLKRGDIDWSQSRVIFLADSFNEYQTGAIGLKGLPIELWEVKSFEKGVIYIDQIKPITTSPESIGVMKKATKELEQVRRKVKTYDINHHFEGKPESRALFDAIRPQILGLEPNVTERITKYYIAFIDNNSGKSFAEVVPRKRRLMVYLRPTIDHFANPVLKLVDCSKIGHWTNGNCYFELSQKEDFPHAVSLIKLALDQVRTT